MQIDSSVLIVLLVLARVGTFFIAMPILSMKQLPVIPRLAVILGLTVMITQWITPADLQITSLLGFGIVILKEAMIGIMLGWLTNVMFLAIPGAGDFVDFFAGLKMSASYDPITGTNASIYSNLYNWLGALLFFMMNGHHYLLRGIVNSCFFLPIGTNQVGSVNLDQVVTTVTQSFLLSIQLALPMVIVLFLVDVVLGLVNRTVQQINVFILGMPLKLLTSFALMLLLFGGFMQSIMWALDSVVQALESAMRYLMI